MTSEAPLDARFLAIAAPIPLQSLFSVVIPHVQSYISRCKPREPPVTMASFPSKGRAVVLATRFVDETLWYSGLDMMQLSS